MNIQTRDFGSLELDENELLTMVTPIYGFEDLKRFALIHDNDIETPFIWLQSVENAEVCFILLNPFTVFPDYHPVATPELLAQLETSSEEDLAWCVVTVIAQDFSKSTANLKSPLVICPKSKKAVQCILEGDYPVRALLMSAEQEERPC